MRQNDGMAVFRHKTFLFAKVIKSYLVFEF